MASDFEEIDLSRIKTISVCERESKVTLRDFGDPVKGGHAFTRWREALPGQLAVKRLDELARAMRRAAAGSGGEIVWMIGAHVIKCGLSRYLIELMRKGYITAIAMNGAAAIHDFEIASFGETSEDVPKGLERGIFGFARRRLKAASPPSPGAVRKGGGSARRSAARSTTGRPRTASTAYSRRRGASAFRRRCMWRSAPTSSTSIPGSTGPPGGIFRRGTSGYSPRGWSVSGAREGSCSTSAPP